jgi:endonuclease YncB( thermonuclease family)
LVRWGQKRSTLYGFVIVLAMLVAGVTYLLVDGDTIPGLFRVIDGHPRLPQVIYGRQPKVNDGHTIRGLAQVIDGDTVRYKGRTVRLVGFDTPETGDRARCEQERALAARASARLRELINTGSASLQFVRCACPPGTDGTQSCNFGRSCGTLKIDGRDVGTILITEGLARPFLCGPFSCPRRRSWC